MGMSSDGAEAEESDSDGGVSPTATRMGADAREKRAGAEKKYGS